MYRICERKNGDLYTLFHGINKSRKMPIGVWLNADVKLVSDGSRKTSKEYLSGFHTIPTLEECRKFSKKFRAKRDLVIVEYEVGNVTWEKGHSPANIILSDKIKLIKIIEEIKL